MGHEAASRGGGFPEHDRSHRAGRPPPAPSRHFRGDSAFHIQTTDQILGISEASLDLDDQETPDGRMEGQDVHAPTIAVVIEARLRLREPPGLPEDAHQPVLQRGMLPIGQRPLAVDSQLDAGMAAQCLRPCFELHSRAFLERGAFPPADGGLRHADADADRALRSSLAPAQRSEGAGDRSTFHGPRMTACVTDPLPPAYASDG